MLLNDYQDRVARATNDSDLTDLLGIGAHAGALLQAHRNFLINDLDVETSRAAVRLQLGLLFNHIATMAAAHDLALEQVALANLEKITRRAKRIGLPEPIVPDDPLSGHTYQLAAAATDQQVKSGLDPLALSVPILGLAGEAGTLLVAQKKAYRDDATDAANPAFLSEELGDLIWYAAAVATHARFNIDEALQIGLDHVLQRHAERTNLANLPQDLPVLDESFPDTERFPRRLVFRFRQVDNAAGSPKVNLTLEWAEPNAFPDGPHVVPGRKNPQGYAVAKPFGDPLTDNSRNADAYRFHDAIHFGFASVLGWSPNTRSLLGLKRRSNDSVDENEDGARAVFAEEGMAAVLAKLAVQRQGFLVEDSVDDDTVAMLTTVLEDLEVSQMPRWIWKRAVAQGFRALRELERSGGGFLTLDLDKRELNYSRSWSVSQPASSAGHRQPRGHC